MQSAGDCSEELSLSRTSCDLEGRVHVCGARTVSLLHSFARCVLGPSIVTAVCVYNISFQLLLDLAKGLSYATSLALTDDRHPYG